MYCPRCYTKMKVSQRSFHKQRKWVCPKCGKVRFQRTNSVTRRRKGAGEK